MGDVTRPDLRVIDFKVPPKGERPPPNEDIIEALRVLLHQAEEGVIQSLAYVATLPDGNAPPATGFVGENRNALAMGLAMLADNVIWRPAHD